MMSFVQKKMVVIAIVAIVNGGGASAASRAAQMTNAHPTGASVGDFDTELQQKEYDAHVGAALPNSSAQKAAAVTEDDSEKSQDGDKSQGVVARAKSMGGKLLGHAKAGWEKHGQPAWEKHGKPVIERSCDKHAKPAHAKVHAAYKKVAAPVKAATATLKKLVAPLKKAVIPEDPFVQAHLLKPVFEGAESLAKQAKLRGAAVKAKITERMPKMGKKDMRHAGYGLALASCLGKQCGCGPWNVMRGMIKLALKPLTKRLNATVYGVALVGCLGFLASKNEGELDAWCSSGCGMQDAMSAATKKANEMAPSEEQVQAGLEGLQAGMMEDLAELKARVMNRKTTNPEDDDKENAAAEENADNGEVGAVGADGANGGRRRAMEAVHHV